MKQDDFMKIIRQVSRVGYNSYLGCYGLLKKCSCECVIMMELWNSCMYLS